MGEPPLSICGAVHTARMDGRDFIDATDEPATTRSLRDDIRALGVDDGALVLVHTSLSRLGYVCGGAQAVVDAVMDAVGVRGTIVMPTHSTGLSDPASWSRPPVPQAWWPTIRAEMPPYDPARTPTRQMGAVVECFRHGDGVERSAHPSVSFAALGPRAEEVLHPHRPEYGLGEQSPLARLYDLDGQVLLLGVDHANNTSLHLAEYRGEHESKTWTTHYSPMTLDGERAWVAYGDLEGEDHDFALVGEAFAATGAETTGPVGAGSGRAMRVRDVVDFGAAWLSAHRR